MSQGQHNLDAFYVAFENRFRGDRQLVKDRQQVYLPYLRFLECSGEDKAILDLGCGRGEWLELLQENGFSCAGVDSNAIMVAQCQERQLPAIEKDVLSFLGEQKDGVYGAVTAFHLLEHLPPTFRPDFKISRVELTQRVHVTQHITGRLELSLRPTELEPLIEATLASTRAHAEAKQIRLSYERPMASTLVAAVTVSSDSAGGVSSRSRSTVSSRSPW